MESRWEVRRLAPSTKLALANALKKLLQKKFLDDITVKELVAAFEEVYGKQLNKAEAGPRPGDVAGCYADPTRAKELLGWQTHLSIADAIRDVLRWTNEERVKVLGY